MTNAQFDFVSVSKKPTVHYGGRSISHVLKLEDGSRKTIGVFLPTPEPLIFQTHSTERIEIISGQCQVQIGIAADYQKIQTGESFTVNKGQQFKIQTDEIIDYVCHFD